MMEMEGDKWGGISLTLGLFKHIESLICELGRYVEMEPIY